MRSAFPRPESTSERPSSISRIAAVALLSAALSASVGVARADREDGANTAAGTTTYTRVWYRLAKHPIRGFVASGDLVVGEDGIRFDHGKRGWMLPWGSIPSILFGRMSGDVDSDWIVLGVRDHEPGPVVGLRDGRKLGFAARTDELFEVLKEHARAASAAQFDLPEGWEPFEGLEHQLTFGVPDGFKARGVEAVVTDGTDVEGRLRVESAEGNAIVVVRRAGGKGKDCAGLREADLRAVLQEVAADRGLREDSVLSDALRSEPFEVDGCSGVRCRGAVTDREGNRRSVDLVVFRQGGALFRFEVDCGDAPCSGSEVPFAAWLETVRLNRAR